MEHSELLRFDQQRSPNQPKWYPEHTENDFGNTSVPKGIVLILFGKGPIEHVGGLQIDNLMARYSKMSAKVILERAPKKCNICYCDCRERERGKEGERVRERYRIRALPKT